MFTIADQFLYLEVKLIEIVTQHILTLQESKEANHSHKSKLQRGLKFQDLDLVLLHNISYEEQVSVVVSDVTSPSMFSVQIKKGSRQLISIQQQIK